MAGLSLIRSACRTNARRFAQDTDTVNPALADADYNDLIEDARQFYCSTFPEEFVEAITVNAAQHDKKTDVTLTGNRLVRDITSAIIPAQSNDPLENPPLADILRYQHSNSAEGVPNKVAWIRQPDDDQKFTFYWHPICLAAYAVQVWTVYEPAVLASDMDPVLFGLHGSRVIARIVGADAANSIGRQDLVPGIIAMLPDRIRERGKTMGRWIAKRGGDGGAVA